MAMMSDAPPEYVLTLDCPDRPGIVHAVAAFLVQSSANIVESQQFDDRTSGRFFMRVLVELVGIPATLDQLRERFEPVARLWDMTWRLFPADEPFRTVVMVSRQVTVSTTCSSGGAPVRSTSTWRRSCRTTATSSHWRRCTACPSTTCR
jgi:predicted amino acid-binding ACT domain protein